MMLILGSILVGAFVMSVSIILEKKDLTMPWIPVFAFVVGMIWGNIVVLFS